MHTCRVWIHRMKPVGLYQKVFTQRLPNGFIWFYDRSRVITQRCRLQHRLKTLTTICNDLRSQICLITPCHVASRRTWRLKSSRKTSDRGTVGACVVSTPASQGWLGIATSHPSTRVIKADSLLSHGKHYFHHNTHDLGPTPSSENNCVSMYHMRLEMSPLWGLHANVLGHWWNYHHHVLNYNLFNMLANLFNHKQRFTNNYAC